MKFKVNKIIGALSFQFEDEAATQLEFFQKASFFSDLPTKCGNPNCGSSNIHLEYREPQGYQYADVICRDCQFQLKFGILKEGKGNLFPKGWSKYSKDETNE